MYIYIYTYSFADVWVDTQVSTIMHSIYQHNTFEQTLRC